MKISAKIANIMLILRAYNNFCSS